MTNTIITIGREFGSGGCEIGHKLAGKLGIKCYDKDISIFAAKRKRKCQRDLKAMMKTNKQLSYSLVMDTYSLLVIHPEVIRICH